MIEQYATTSNLPNAIDSMATTTIKNGNSVVRYIDFTYSINANSSYSRNLKTLIDDDLPSGYRFGGLAGFASNNIQTLTTNFGYYDSQYSLQLANRGGSAISNQIFRVLYIAVPI